VGFGRVSGQQEQSRRHIDSETCPHNGEEPLKRPERNVGRNAKNAQVNHRIRANHQGHPDGVKKEYEIEAKYRL
jgi:hypothetical protein